jgi:hypothetical protein
MRMVVHAATGRLAELLSGAAVLGAAVSQVNPAPELKRHVLAAAQSSQSSTPEIRP